MWMMQLKLTGRRLNLSLIKDGIQKRTPLKHHLKRVGISRGVQFAITMVGA